MSEFKDYPADQIAAKLKQVEDFENKYKPNATTRGWRKWCTDPAYRKREWQSRQALANYAKHSAHKAFSTNDKSVL
jgi:hypothetical protein